MLHWLSFSPCSECGQAEGSQCFGSSRLIGLKCKLLPKNCFSRKFGGNLLPSAAQGEFLARCCSSQHLCTELDVERLWPM